MRLLKPTTRQKDVRTFRHSGAMFRWAMPEVRDFAAVRRFCSMGEFER